MRSKVVFYAVLILSFICACTAQKDIHQVSSTSIGVVDTSSIDTGAQKMAGSWWRLYTFCDSIHLRIWADSVVTPSGSVIHNPNIDMTAQQPSVAAESGELLMEADSVHAERNLLESKDSSTLTEDRSSTASSGGFRILPWLLIMVILFPLCFYISYRYYTRNKS